MIVDGELNHSPVGVGVLRRGRGALSSESCGTKNAEAIGQPETRKAMLDITLPCGNATSTAALSTELCLCEAVVQPLPAALFLICAVIAGLRAYVTVTPWQRPETPADLDEHPLRGKSVLFTGTLERCDRKSAQAMVTAVGGVAARSVNADLDVLVIGAGRGAKSSKQKKAEALVEKGASIQLMGEAEFLTLVGPDRE